MDESLTSQEPAIEKKQIEIDNKGPIGLDIGTVNIVVARNNNGKGIRAVMQPNAFYTVPCSRITKLTLLRNEILFFEKDKQFYILGEFAEKFANMLGGNTRRPIENGLINPKEDEGVCIIMALITKLLKKPQKKDERIFFSVPGEPIDGPGSVLFHEGILKMHLKNMGYDPVSINEGLAVIFSELAYNEFTGIGISLGGGMCNICLSYLSIPVISYSIRKGGDYIDQMVANSVGENVSKVKMVKEKELDFTVSPKNKIEIGIHIYYDELFTSLVKSLQQVLGSSTNMPKLNDPLPVVLSGGTVLPKGSQDKFKKILNSVRLPFKVQGVALAENPLLATAKGALMMAKTEEDA